MIDRDLVYYAVQYKDRNDLLQSISKDLISKGYVTSEYPKKIVEREDQYPTGLMLKGLNIAICHADPQYALKSTLFVARLLTPVEFRNAENFSRLEVEMVIGLVITTGEEHLKMLQKVAQLLLDHQFVRAIKDTSCKEELVELFERYFSEETGWNI